MIHIKNLKLGTFFSFLNGSKLYKVNRFSSNRKYLFYIDEQRNEYSLDRTQDYYVIQS